MHNDENRSFIKNNYYFLSSKYTNRHVAVLSGVSASAKASEVTHTRFVLAHRSFGARIVSAVRFLFLAVYSAESVLALATVALGQINTRTAVVTGLRCAFVDVDLATFSRKSSGTETLNSMAERYAKAAV